MPRPIRGGSVHKNTKRERAVNAKCRSFTGEVRSRFVGSLNLSLPRGLTTIGNLYYIGKIIKNAELTHPIVQFRRKKAASFIRGRGLPHVGVSSCRIRRLRFSRSVPLRVVRIGLIPVGPVRFRRRKRRLVRRTYIADVCVTRGAAARTECYCQQCYPQQSSCRAH
jgi:hypothetical protein